ncbi:hypothetical protein [Streptomyces candidus]|uniref:Uncharacterized protein n=1 Tax=Streptomyces candidus TaxID=67283 RepID=A0A7X0LTU6_9ACTN|nr:hypothetical protein [Streptomyces candidus]MBB6439411.1 hypothetical protein [Streptomyces candidus]GHH54845.1 hypothetical protein GCM10018773_58460 [Streptomyces candidus]
MTDTTAHDPARARHENARAAGVALEWVLRDTGAEASLRALADRKEENQ